MQIVTTRQAYEEAVGSQSVGYMGLTQKIDASYIHAGHEYLVDYSKARYDLVAVNIWSLAELVWEIYRPQSFSNITPKAWDEEGCLAWCESKGVDIVLNPAFGYATQYLNGVDLLAARANFEKIWTEYNYKPYEINARGDIGRENTILNIKTFMLIQALKNPLNQHYVGTWKDGLHRFMMADYINKYTQENYVLLDPILSPEGIYYSSSYFKCNEQQKFVIASFPTIVDSVGYSNTNTLKAALNQAGQSEGLIVYRIDILRDGVVGEGNDFINIYYLIDNEFTDSYPIYKKGVR